jgi:hypothetical protein
MEEVIAHIRFVRDTTIERSLDFLMNMKPAFNDISSFERKVTIFLSAIREFFK